jgi:hypothetical protein
MVDYVEQLHEQLVDAEARGELRTDGTNSRLLAIEIRGYNTVSSVAGDGPACHESDRGSRSCGKVKKWRRQGEES